MAYLLDTNIAVHAREGAAPVLAKLARHEGSVMMSALSLAELQRGLYKRPELTSVRMARMASLLDAVPVLAFDAAAAHAYGQIIRRCGWAKGRDFDRMIAAHAISADATLVTNNTADFRDIPGLRLEDWVEEPL